MQKIRKWATGTNNFTNNYNAIKTVSASYSPWLLRIASILILVSVISWWLIQWLYNKSTKFLDNYYNFNGFLFQLTSKLENDHPLISCYSSLNMKVIRFGDQKRLPSPQSSVPFLAYFCCSPLLGILSATFSLANYGSFSKTQFRPISWLSNSLPFPKSPPHTPGEHCYCVQSTMCLLLSQKT